MRTGEDIDKLRDALTVVIKSEHVGEECESANHHHLQDFLEEIREDLHICVFDGKKHDYGDSYEIECSVDNCNYTEYVEVDV